MTKDVSEANHHQECLQTLFQIAQDDRLLLQVQSELKKIPKAIAEARRQLDIQGKELQRLSGPTKSYQEQITEKEATIKVAKDTIQKFEEHMAKVTTQKEYLAAKKQVDEAKRQGDMLQEQILEARMKIEDIAPKMAESQERYENLLATFSEDEKGLNKKLEELKKQERTLQKSLEKLIGKLENKGEFTTQYKRLLRGKKQPAVVALKDHVCAGCHMALPHQSLNIIISQPEKIHTCSYCHRIVFYFIEEAPSEEE